MNRQEKVTDYETKDCKQPPVPYERLPKKQNRQHAQVIEDQLGRAPPEPVVGNRKQRLIKSLAIQRGATQGVESHDGTAEQHPHQECQATLAGEPSRRLLSFATGTIDQRKAKKRSDGGKVNEDEVQREQDRFEDYHAALP